MAESLPLAWVSVTIAVRRNSSNGKWSLIMFTLSVFGEDLLGREKRPWKPQHFSSFRGMGDGGVGTVLLCCVCVCVPAAAVLVSGFGFGIRTNVQNKWLRKKTHKASVSSRPLPWLRAEWQQPCGQRRSGSAPRTAPSVSPGNNLSAVESLWRQEINAHTHSLCDSGTAALRLIGQTKQIA